MVVTGKLLDPVGWEASSLSLLQHVVSRVNPPVGTNFFKCWAPDWLPLEDPHEEPCAFHGAFLVEPFKLESDLEDIILCFFRSFSLERKLA